MKPKSLITLFAALLVLAAVVLTGCNTPEEHSQLPWSQPADWEGRVPGMPGG